VAIHGYLASGYWVQFTIIHIRYHTSSKQPNYMQALSYTIEAINSQVLNSLNNLKDPKNG